MGLFDMVKDVANSAANAIDTAANAVNPKSETFSFPALPNTVDELINMPGADLTNPFAAAALCIAVLTPYDESKSETIEMLN